VRRRTNAVNMPAAETMRDRMTACATPGTEEMASTAMVNLLNLYINDLLLSHSSTLQSSVFPCSNVAYST